MRTPLLAASLGAMALVVACSASDNTTAAAGAAAAGIAPAAKPVQEPPPPPFEYPAPVKGHYKEINTGDFDLVDGLAYPDPGGTGTVVFVTSKPIASPVLNAATCPMTEARAIALIRDASYAEVIIDAKGGAKYYSAGTNYEGQGRSQDVGGREWTIAGGAPVGGKVEGSVNYRGRGTFEFTLPVFTPKEAEVTASAIMDGHRIPDDRRAPTEAELTKAYTDMRRAALAKDLKAMLALQGFDAKQVQAIRGLAGIDAELPAHADRFLDPGEPEEATVQAGFAQIGGKGKNSKGDAFFNFYTFTPCGNRLLLTSIGLNPQ